MVLEGLALQAVIGSVLPAVTDAFSSLIQKFTGGAGALPKNVDEVIKLEQAKIDHLKALAELDTAGGNLTPWVADVRALLRPTLCVAGFLGAVFVGFIPGVPQDSVDFLQQLGTLTTTYIFGERMIMGMKGRKK